MNNDDWCGCSAAEGYAAGGRDAMCAFARRTLRRRFLAADLGITGVNLAVAETGTLSVTNEGNGRLTAVPPIHVAVMGMERVVADWAEADLLLALLAAPAPAWIDLRNCVTGPRRATSPTGRTSCTW